MDYTNLGTRKTIIDEILSDENKRRKEEHQKRYEIYRERQGQFVTEMLLKELSAKTVQEMRVTSSINLAKRIVDELASIYKTPPERVFQTLSEQKLTQQQVKQCENLYKFSNANVKFKKANKWFELHQQCSIQTIPRNGVIDLRVLAPHQYDVVPKADSPDTADAYIINTFDRGTFLSGLSSSGNTYDLSKPSRANVGNSYYSDGKNQKIGDPDDYRENMQFVWWTEEFNFITNGNGLIVQNGSPIMNPDFNLFRHELGELPFDDISEDKDFEFWVRAGNGITDFSIEFLALLSDIFNIHKMQGFAQAIIYSEKPPADMRIGTNNIIHIPLDPNKEVQPRFEFASPNPDMQASLTLLENFLRMFLTSRGIDPKTVSGTIQGTTYSSGIERLLAMIEKFEASRDTFDLFKQLEMSVFNKMKKWSNLMQGATVPSSTTLPLVAQLREATLPDDAFVTVNYSSPEVIQTKAEREDSSIKMKDAGLMSRSEAIQFIRGVDEAKSLEILKKIDKESMISLDEEEDSANEVEDQPE